MITKYSWWSGVKIIPLISYRMCSIECHKHFFYIRFWVLSGFTEWRFAVIPNTSTLNPSFSLWFPFALNMISYSVSSMCGQDVEEMFKIIFQKVSFFFLFAIEFLARSHSNSFSTFCLEFHLFAFCYFFVWVCMRQLTTEMANFCACKKGWNFLHS